MKLLCSIVNNTPNYEFIASVGDLVDCSERVIRWQVWKDDVNETLWEIRNKCWDNKTIKNAKQPIYLHKLFYP